MRYGDGLDAISIGAPRLENVAFDGSDMKAGKPSATAEAMAAARALGTVIYRPEAILDDPYADQFLGSIRIYPFLRIARAERAS